MSREYPLTTNRARASTKRTTTVSEAKAKVLELVKSGASVKDAMAAVDRSTYTYNDWRDGDQAFREEIDRIRAVAAAARKRGENGKVEVPDFPEFCEKYLGMPVPEHHMRVWDVINGRPPRSMHPAIRYQVGRPQRVLLNFPPYHAKSTVWSAQYSLWRMMKDPNVRIAIVSQTQVFAKKLVHQIKQYLELPQFEQLHRDFMPESGWVGSGWTKTEIYLSGVDVAQKDPTLQALGLGGQIYGSRLDVVIMDDLVTGKNVHSYKELADYVGTEVASRVDDDGVLICLGTRMGANDLYSELRDLMEWDGDESVWTYFAQPAVLEQPEHDPDSWVTLWPAKWPGRSLARLRAEANTEARWQTTYQQMDASIEQVFPSGAVYASVDGRRASGPMENLYCVLGVDPAANGTTAMSVLGVDRTTGRVYLLDGFSKTKCPPDLFMQTMRDLILRHKVRECVIETNAVQGFIARQQDFRDFAFSNGCIISEHTTGGQKWDPDLGVSSLSPWFQSCATHDAELDLWKPRPSEFHKISLPNPKFSGGWCQTLIDQLVAWQPREGQRQQKAPTDSVMSLWFASIGIQKVLDQAKNVPRHMANPFITRADARNRGVVNLQQAIEQKLNAAQEVPFYA